MKGWSDRINLCALYLIGTAWWAIHELPTMNDDFYACFCAHALILAQICRGRRPRRPETNNFPLYQMASYKPVGASIARPRRTKDFISKKGQARTPVP